MKITVGARSSPLSKEQVREVLSEIQKFHPEVEFLPSWFETTGDKDLETSLKTLGNSDFFSKEIDEKQLNGEFRLSIHSAKDLPEPLKNGLQIIALTEGKDPRDALVFRENETLATLCPHAKIATSSLRRDDCITMLREDLVPVDIRGTIHKRLEALFSGRVDGVVIAKAALIRLGLENLNHMLLPVETPPRQGRLAIVAKDDDEEMKRLFSCLDVKVKKRPHILYLGLRAPQKEAPQLAKDAYFTHAPIIQTRAFPLSEESRRLLSFASHLLITSKTAIAYLLEQIEDKNKILNIPCFAVGKSTATTLLEQGFTTIYTAEEETQEGLIELITSTPFSTPPTFFWPHSKSSRKNLAQFLTKHHRVHECVLYETVPNLHFCIRDIQGFDALFFTSPSTIQAYLYFFKNLPTDKTLFAIGKITYEALQTHNQNNQLTIKRYYD
jgi:hydroxymethylbilane synthase